MEVCKQSKSWWDEELWKQVRNTRRTKKTKKAEGINQKGRVRMWKAEKEKMKMMVREKKKECWKRF